ncbi:PBECR4 domain-containing protein [Clostridium perfringens]|uniref:PBECR4 domain-containing protein n=1 Tax=Clostridium perfringens TaxID=1502 RepID=UPI0030D3967D
MQDIIKDYENLIFSTIKIPIYGDELIEFSFKMENLPHLLGLNKLVDIEIFENFANKKNESVNAHTIIDKMKENEITMEFIKSSAYFDRIYEDKIKYFSSQNILKTLKNSTIIKFNPDSIKDFQTKLDKVDYLFYEIIVGENGKYYHFGIGFSLKENAKNFPNTFFARDNDDYIKSEKDKVYPTSIYIKDRFKKIFFKIYWNNIRERLILKRKSYKSLKKVILKYNLDMFKINKDNINKFDIDSNDLEILKNDFIKLRRDEVYEAYKPHIEFKSWNNEYKDYLVNLVDNSEKEILPNKVKALLNEFKSKAERKYVRT